MTYQSPRRLRGWAQEMDRKRVAGRAGAVQLGCQGPGGRGSSSSVQPQWQRWVQPAASVARSQGSGVLVEVRLGCNVGGCSQQRGLRTCFSSLLRDSVGFPIFLPESYII